METKYGKGVKKSESHRLNIAKAKIGNKNPNWKGGRIKRQGYVLIKVYNHPYSVDNYIKEHRYIMEQHIGRYLTKNEIVHHINGIKDDNRIENLVLCKSVKEHINSFHPKNNPNNTPFKRQCSKCKIIKNLTPEFFNRCSKEPQGFMYICRECRHKFNKNK